MFQNVGTVATDIYAAAFMGYAIRGSSLCSPLLDECTPPKNPLSSSAIGLRLSGRQIGAAIEMRTEQQSTYFTRYRFNETTSAHRETRLSVMARVNLSTRNRSRLAVVAGPAFSLGKTKNVSFRREGVVPYAGPTPYEWSRGGARGHVWRARQVCRLGAGQPRGARAVTMLKRDRDSELGSSIPTPRLG